MTPKKKPRGRPRKSAAELAARGSWRAKARRAEEAAGWIPPIETEGISVDHTPTPIYRADRPAVVTLFADSPAACRLTINADGHKPKTFRLRAGIVSKTPVVDALPLAAGANVSASVDCGEAVVYGYADSANF